MSPSLTVASFIDEAALSTYQKRVVALCLGLGLAEGINALSLGYVIPALSELYDVPPAAFAFIFITALIGEIIGNFVLAPLGDKFGRRTMIRVGILIFGTAAVVSAFVGSVEALAVCRFFAGFGIGAAVPSVFTLASDFSPNRTKGRVISILSMSISAGGFLIGLVASEFIPNYGGAAFLALGGVLPLVLLAATWWALPESVAYLADQNRQEAVRRTLRRIAPESLDRLGDDAVFAPAERAQGARVVLLFKNGRLPQTVLIWVLSFLGLFNSYFIFSFLATILIIDGVPEPASLLSVSLATFGGMVGGVALGLLMDRTSLGVAAGSLGTLLAIVGFLVLMVVPADSGALVFAILGAALGAGAIGANSCSQVLATQIYPATIRSTGLGWYSAMGRLGGLVAPSLIGALLAANVSPNALYGTAIVPLALTGGVLVFFAIRYRSRLRETEPREETTETLGAALASSSPSGARTSA
ncbi:MFS transporter [Leucobacter allii]|uniref:MFS transporter n=1 Tax=Leucobacter allii TaxID=2932247 RepID=A0ABY4FMM4_9MICO|nr:MFS transporter [Leucobacter allii]UOQ57520.1 MFS transporter [Leucobacter allii]